MRRPIRAARWEQELILRLGTALLREDVAGLRTRGVLLPVPRPVPGRAHRTGSPARAHTDLWLALNGLRIPVRLGSPERGDLVSDLIMRRPEVLRVAPAGRFRAARLSSVIRLLETELLRSVAPELAAEFHSGFQALLVEAEAAGEAARARHRRRPGVLGRLRRRPVSAPEFWLTAESLAAHRDHPIYPLSIARVGLRPRDLPRWAPEHAPRFGLSWVGVPREHVTSGGELPTWWPGEDEVVLPVHPAMNQQILAEALKNVPWRPLPVPRLQVRPTLSMRTVVPGTDPSVHLKVPLPMRTLGRLNLRLLSQAALADGAVLTRSLRALLRQDFGGTVLTADESTWLHADNHLAVLVRRWPALGEAKVVPVAGLTARRWDGKLFVQVLAEEFYDADLDRFLDAYLHTLLNWQLALWLRYGMVHEAHPQNVLVAVDRHEGSPRLRLLLRDLDSCLVDPELAEAGLGAHAPGALADHRLIAKDPVDLATMFVTTTLHQCVASVLIETAVALDRPVTPLLGQARHLLREIAEAHPHARDTELLTSGVIHAERLPVKRTLTAATLLPKSRTGAADVNKFYGADAPSYL